MALFFTKGAGAPHYLHFAAENVPDGDPRFKCAPPIRGWEDQLGLRILLMNGFIGTVGSDHSPAPPFFDPREPRCAKLYSHGSRR